MRINLVCVVALMALVLASSVRGAADAAGSSEGIRVHGAWTIDVFNEDGTLDKHVEFNNALTQGGVTITYLMNGSASSSDNWIITFGETNSAGVCPSETTGRCVIGPINSLFLNNVSGTGVRLSGSTTVEASGTIEHVNTRLGTCSGSGTAPGDCNAIPQTSAATPTFTAKELDAGDVTTVSAGQTVQIQVDIYFN